MRSSKHRLPPSVASSSSSLSSSSSQSSWRKWATLFLCVFAMGLIVGYEYYIIRFIADHPPSSIEQHQPPLFDPSAQIITEEDPFHPPRIEVFRPPISNNLRKPDLPLISIRIPVPATQSLQQQQFKQKPLPPSSLQQQPEDPQQQQQQQQQRSSLINIEKRIFPEPISLAYNLQERNPAVLIVGGTDGSGTRSVVQTLTDLGVSIVSEDPETFDIHADLVGGWPPIVNPVLHDVSNLRYSMLSLSAGTRSFMSVNLERLLQKVKQDSTRPTSYTLAVGGRLPTPPDTTAKKVLYGFKAPIAMTLLPLWTYFLSNCIFIHVVRDGRDIAFSVNQGPVEKFYSSFYKGKDLNLPAPIKAIKLWSDWNSDIYEFAHQYYQTMTKQQEITKSFGYHVIHTEDLVQDANIPIKFNAIYHLAKFVDSSLSNDQLCCLAKRNSQFMGSHDRSPRKKDPAAQASQVKSRYGKWKQHTNGNPQLLQQLLLHGKRGLKFLGYEPARKLPDAVIYPEEEEEEAEEGGQEGEGGNVPIKQNQKPSPQVVYTTKDGYECKLTNKQCREYYPESFSQSSSSDPLPKDISPYLAAGACKGQRGVDYKGDDLNAVSINEKDPAGCCRICKTTVNCRYWTLDPFSNVCYLKTGNSNAVANPRLISGSIH